MTMTSNDKPVADGIAGRAAEQIQFGAVRTKHLCETPAAAPAQVVELKKPILRLGVAEAEKEIRVAVGVDVRDAPGIALDLHGATDADVPNARHLRNARTDLG